MADEVEVVDAAPVESEAAPEVETPVTEEEEGPSKFEKELQAVYTEPDDDEPPVEKDEEEAKEPLDSEQDSEDETPDASDVEASKISDELLARGEAAGYTAEEVQKLVDAGLAEKVLPPLDNTDGRSEHQDAEQKTDPEPSTTDWPEIPDLDPDEYDEAVVKSFSGLKQQNKALRETIGQVQQQLGAIFAVNLANQMDQWMGEKPEYREVLGTGNLEQIEPEVAAKRIEVLAKMDTLAAGYINSGKPQPDQRQLFDEAFMAIHGRTLVKSAGDKAKADVKAKLQKQRNQLDLRPTAREALSSRSSLSLTQQATLAVALAQGKPESVAMREALDAADDNL